MTLIIGFGNKARHGKDTAATAIMEYAVLGDTELTDVRRYKYATALYEEVNFAIQSAGSAESLLTVLRGTATAKGEVFPEWVTCDPNPEVSDLAPHGKHPKILQWWGTELRRSSDSEYWVKRLYEEIERDKPEVALITDVRFPNEGDAVRARGGYTVNLTRLNVDGTLYVDPSRPADHISETAMDSYNWDYKLFSKSKEFVGSQAVNLVKFLKGLK